MKEISEERLSVFCPIRLQSESPGRREYGVRFIRAGRVRRRDGSESNWVIPASTLRSAVELFDSVAVFVDHTESSWLVPSHPSVRNLAAVTFAAEYNEEDSAIDGGIRLYDSDNLSWLRQLLDQLVEDQVAGDEIPDVGLSAVFFAEHEWNDGPDDIPIRTTTKFTHVESVDIVFGPGADGRVKEILSVGGVVMPDENGKKDEDRFTRLERQVAQMQAEMTSSLSQLVDVLAGDEEVVVGMGDAPRDPPPQINVGHPLAQMWSSGEKILAAYEQLMGVSPSDPKVEFQRLTGIRELYILMTGDSSMTGVMAAGYRPPRIRMDQLAYSSSGNNADTTTMAELTRNVMNKVLIEQINMLDEYNWWRRVVRIENFNSLQQVSWIRYGGIGYDSGTGLPTVAEKGEYQQLLWEDDRTTASWEKHGGYLALSLEMIDRDDTMGWRSVPQQLALAAVVSLSSTVSTLFTANSGAGADLSDGVGDGYAFNTTRGNLITDALDYDSWNLSINTMYKLAQLKNSSQTEDRRIAARPRYLLVPIELEAQGISVVTSAHKPGTDFNDQVATKRLLPEDNVIVVPHWTDTDNWAALADPRLLPFAGVGFRFGDTPELFTSMANTMGNHIFWLHDVLPIKVRWFYAVSVVETRGAIKSNV